MPAHHAKCNEEQVLKTISRIGFHLISALLFPVGLLQNLLNVEKIHAIMSFLPIILNQLFKVLVQNEEDEISTTVTRYP